MNKPLKDTLKPVYNNLNRISPDESREVSRGLDVLPNAIVPGPLLEERIDDSLDLLPLDSQGGGSHLLSLPLFAFLVDHLAIGYLYNLKS